MFRPFFVSYASYLYFAMRKKKVIVAITGASGSIYAKLLLDNLLKLTEQVEKVGVVMSDNAKRYGVLSWAMPTMTIMVLIFTKKWILMLPLHQVLPNSIP